MIYNTSKYFLHQQWDRLSESANPSDDGTTNILDNNVRPATKFKNKNPIIQEISICKLKIKDRSKKKKNFKGTMRFPENQVGTLNVRSRVPHPEQFQARLVPQF